MADLLTLAQGREAVGATAEDDAELSWYIGLVSELLERKFGPLAAGTYTRDLPSLGGTVFLPPYATVGSVQQGSVVLSGYTHNVESGLLSGIYGYGPVTVTFTVPESRSVQWAARLTLKHNWSMRAAAVPTVFDPNGAGGEVGMRTFVIPQAAVDALSVGARVA